MLIATIILTTGAIATYGLIVIVRSFEFQRAIERMREQTSWGDVAFVCEEMRAAAPGTWGDEAARGQRPFAQDSAIARHRGGL